ncbi:glycosyltransferase family 4 protein [Azospirillum sp. sgz301742]
MTDTAAIYYHPDAFSVERGDVKGRHSAGAGFLAAAARHHRAETLYCYAANMHLAQECAGSVQRYAGRQRPVGWIALSNPAGLRDPGCVFLPGPGLGEHAWQRRFFDQRNHSICGVTHTICTDRVMDAFGQLLLAPVQPWDALIVTSNPAKEAILRVFGMWQDYLRERLGAAPKITFQMPVIPLGVHCDTFAATEASRQAGADLRQRLGIGPDDVAALYFGRLSFHAKAHPSAMFSACEAAQRRTSRRIHLIMTGAFPNPSIEQAFRAAARRLCPSVNVAFVDGGDSAAAAASWSAADFFISLADNIQETFGLTPVEAMAAGLPAIVADWDGYRDTVVSGETGFRIPTLVPAAGAGRDLALRYLIGAESTDRYMGAVSQSTSVDIGASADAVLRLTEDDALRRRMAEAASRRARTTYDWSVVMTTYEELWAELARLRRVGAEAVPLRPSAEPYPLRADPFAAFAGFATQQLAPNWSVACAADDPPLAIAAVAADPMCNFTAQLLLPPEASVQMANAARATSCTVGDLVALFAMSDADKASRTLMWLVKYGILKVAPAP